MNVLRRITATLSGSVESAVNHLENHDALVEASLRQTRALAAETRVRLARVRQDGLRLGARITELQDSEVSWSNRALSLAGSEDEEQREKALECIRRRNHVRQQKLALNKSLDSHNQQEKTLQQTLASIETRLSDIENNRNMLRTRASAAEAQRVANKLDSSPGLAVDDVLERWEMRILQAEYGNPATGESDAFAAEFENQEDRESLQLQLDELQDREQES